MAPERLASIQRQLDAETQTLSTAHRAAEKAQQILSRIIDRLGNPDRDQAAEQAKNTAAEATFEHRPLFDGRFTFQVGGGSLALPDYRSGVPSREHAVRTRDDVDQYRIEVIERRLSIVDRARSASTMAAGVIQAAALGVGSLMDVTV
jgi:hypothetical protein